MRDQNDDHISMEKREEIKKELGDCLWYISAIATELLEDLETIANDNIHKLYDRQERGVISGEGDGR